MGNGGRKMSLRREEIGEVGDINVIEANKKGLEKRADHKSQKLLEGGP